MSFEMKKLKNCPCCGGNMTADNDDGESVVWIARCDKCGQSFGLGFGTQQDYDRLNRRPNN